MMTTTGGCVREETARPRGTDDGNIVARDREDDRGGRRDGKRGRER